MKVTEPTYFLFSGKLFHAVAFADPSAEAKPRRGESGTIEPHPRRGEDPGPEGPEGEPVGEDDEEDEDEDEGEDEKPEST